MEAKPVNSVNTKTVPMMTISEKGYILWFEACGVLHKLFSSVSHDLEKYDNTSLSQPESAENWFSRALSIFPTGEVYSFKFHAILLMEVNITQTS